MAGKRQKNPIFFDAGKRWQRLKIAGLITLVFAAVLSVIAIYAYWYNPFPGQKNALNEKQVDIAVDEINSEQRPVYNQGTFLTVEDVYGEEFVKRFGEDRKQVVLSFDDGPDPKITNQILDVLKKENVPGTFYLIGSQLYKHPETAKQIVAQGSEVGLHTYSHYDNPKDERLSSLEFKKELDFSEKIFMHVFGYKTLLFRIPYLGLDEKLSYNSIQYVGEGYKRGLVVSAPTADSLDWEEHRTHKSVYERSTNAEVRTVVILFHDAGGNRDVTLQTLPSIIKFYKEHGYEFVTTRDLAHQNGLTTDIPMTVQDKLLSPIAFYTHDIYVNAPLVLQKGFIVGFAFVLLHTVVIVALALIYKAKKRIRKDLGEDYKRLVSIIIPMHNEAQSIKGTVGSILKSIHQNFEIIVVDDGSTDNSYKKALPLAKNPKVRVFSKPNGGKFSALNFGISQAKGAIVVCIDADTRLTPSALREILRPFSDKKVGAVAGNIKVGNAKTFLTRIQNLEYIVAQSIEKSVNELFGFVPIVPGAFGAWRKSVIKKAGGFKNHTHAEDFDLTMDVIQRGYKVRYMESAIAHTEAPTALSQLFIQRLRWNFGNLQVFVKHRDMLFNKKYGAFGFFLFPRFVLVQVPAILLTPLVDIFIILNILVGERGLTLLFLCLYLVIQFFVVLTALLLSSKKDKDVLHFVFLRFPYTQIIYIALIAAFIQALKGEIIAWKTLHHTGDFSDKKKKSAFATIISNAKYMPVLFFENIQSWIKPQG